MATLIVISHLYMATLEVISYLCRATVIAEPSKWFKDDGALTKEVCEFGKFFNKFIATFFS